MINNISTKVLTNTKKIRHNTKKGGILVTSMFGVAMRSTMDIDTGMRNLTLT